MLRSPSIIIFIGCYRTRNATAEQFTFPLMFRAFLSIASRKDRETVWEGRKGEREAFCVAVALKGKALRLRNQRNDAAGNR